MVRYEGVVFQQPGPNIKGSSTAVGEVNEGTDLSLCGGIYKDGIWLV